MKNHHCTIYIGESLHKNEKEKKQSCMKRFIIPLSELPKRMFTSFLPPVHPDWDKVYVDLLGPFLIYIILAGILHSSSFSYSRFSSLHSPFIPLLFYSTLIPCILSPFLHMASSTLNTLDLISILGYASFGHVLTLFPHLLIPFPSDPLFFLSLSLFGGLTTLRVVLILSFTIPRPPARLIFCSLVSILHLLFLIFLYFSYVHKTFMYGKHSA